MARSLVAIATFAAALAAAAGAAAAPVQLGPDITALPPSGGFHFAAIGCDNGAFTEDQRCWFLNDIGAGAAPTEAPFNGVVTKFRFRAGCCGDGAPAQERRIRLRVYTEGFYNETIGYPTRVGVRTGPAVVIPAGAELLSDPFVEVPVSPGLRIDKGEQPGLDVDRRVTMLVYDNLPGSFLFAAPPGGHNEEGYEAGANRFNNVQLAFNAIVEPDGDGDGYGDDSQDCHPADPALHEGSCHVPPPTGPTVDPPAAGVSCPGPCGTGPSTAVVFILPPSASSVSYSKDYIFLPLRCPASAPVACVGRYEAKAGVPNKASVEAARKITLAKGSFKVAPGKKKKLKVKLSRKGRKLLRKQRRLPVVITIRPAGGKVTTIKKTLRLPR